ncbi:MAG: sensor histidine kinase [Ilumatobacteraceae bacterium]
MASVGPDTVETWRRPLAWSRDHPFAADTTLAVVLTVIALVVHAGSPRFDVADPVRDPAWWTPLLVVAATMPLMYRRQRPIAVLVAVAGAQIVCELVDVNGANWIGLLVAVYSVGAHSEGRPRLRAVVGVGLAVGVLLALGVAGDEVTPVDAVAASGMLAVAFVVGDNLRRRRQHLDSLADRAERAEREREILARERVAEERARIARELHDIVAHSVSVMVIQASAARRSLTSRPDAAEGLLENIERTGRETMDELRQVLGVLRNDDGGPPGADRAVPVPTITDLPALIEAAAGLTVRMAVTGIVDHVPAGVGVSVYRVVQEGITNANRHAGPGATIDVRVTGTATDVVVRIEDNGRGASASRTTDGYGLIGMRERVASAGGTLDAGPRPGGGWRVSARFPLQPGTVPVDAGARLVS